MTEPIRNKAALAVVALMLAPALCLAESAPAAPAASHAVAIALPSAPKPLMQPALPVYTTEEYKEADVWGRIRTGYAIPDIENQLVAKHVQWYSTRPDYIARTSARASRYMFEF